MGDEQPPAPAAPPPGGLGDEPSQPEPDVPQFGLTIDGERPLEPPGIRDTSRPRALPPKRHDLDPYVPIGFKLGSFLLFTEAEIGTILTDNVLAKFDTHSDAAFEFAPNVRLESNWGRHFFSAEFDADRSWYKDFPIEDDRDYQALLRGRLDVTRRTHLELELGKSQTQEGRDSISLTDILGAQTNVIEEHLTASARPYLQPADHEAHRHGCLLQLRRDHRSCVRRPRSDLYRRAHPVRGREGLPGAGADPQSTYEFQPEVAAFVEGSINERAYREPINEAGLRRDSEGFTVLTGLNFRLTGKLTGEVSVGWGEQQSIDRLFGPIEGFLVNADIIWQPTPMTKVEFIARSEVDETSLVDSLGAVDRFYELSLQHAFWRYLVLGTYVSYEIADYADNPLVDERLKEGLTAEYYFNPYMSAYAGYEHTDFFSTEAANEFIENEVRLGMRIRR